MYIRKFYDIGSDASLGAATGSVIPGIGSLAGGLIGGGIGLVTGLFQKKKGNALLNQPRPVEQIPQEVLANQQIAQNMATEGLPSQQYQQGIKNIQRAQLAAQAKAQDLRSGVASIGAIQQQTNDATGNLDVANAEARRQNQLGLMNVNNQVAGWRDKVFDWNQKQRYLQDQAYGRSLLGAGNANLYGGIDKILGSGLQAATSGLFGGGNGNNNVNKNYGNPSYYNGYNSNSDYGSF